MPAYTYTSNASPRDRFEKLKFLLDNGREATLLMGFSYELTASEVARARQYIQLVDSDSVVSPPTGEGSGSGSPYWGAPILTQASLPISNNFTGEVRLVRSEGALYWWDGSSWNIIVGGGGGSTSDYIEITHDGALVSGDMLVWDGTIFDTEAP